MEIVIIMNCEKLCFTGYTLMGIAVLLAVFFFCFYIIRKKKLHQQLEHEYGNIKSYTLN